MNELLSQKRFLSAAVASILVAGVYYLFKDNPEMAEQISYQICGLFGLHIAGTSISDSWGKGKVEKEKEKAEIEKETALITKAREELVAKAGNSIAGSVPDGEKPW